MVNSSGQSALISVDPEDIRRILLKPLRADRNPPQAHTQRPAPLGAAAVEELQRRDCQAPLAFWTPFGCGLFQPRPPDVGDRGHREPQQGAGDQLRQPCMWR